MSRTLIHQALVGSRAHGLNRPDSDFDFRGIFVDGTSEILSLGHKYSPTSWIEGDMDDTSYEIGHFLQLATKANPAVLEVLVSDELKVETRYSADLKYLFKYMFDANDAFNAFAGYSTNQRKKLLDDHLGRKYKFGVAYVRTAYCLEELLRTGWFHLKISDPTLREILTDIRAGKCSDGEIIDLAEKKISEAKLLIPSYPNVKDLRIINDFLLDIRKDFW